MSDFVTAYRNGKQQRFTRRSWEVMGTDKYGWALVPDAPKEVSRLVTLTTSTALHVAQSIEQTSPITTVATTALGSGSVYTIAGATNESTPAPKKRKKSKP